VDVIVEEIFAERSTDGGESMRLVPYCRQLVMCLVSLEIAQPWTRGNRGGGDPRIEFNPPPGGGRVPPWGRGC
jgi:hypothetical protein